MRSPIFGAPQPFPGELGVLYWYYAMSRSGDGFTDVFDDVQHSPADALARDRFDALLTQNESIFSEGVMVDTSYPMSPTFWFTSIRYSPFGTTPRTRFPVNTDLADPEMPASVAQRRFDEVRYPSSKVLLFERFDFEQRSRNATFGFGLAGVPAVEEASPPQWNNPTASPNMAASDGSVIEANIRRIYDRLPEGQFSLGLVDDPYIPIDAWNPPPNAIGFTDGPSPAFDPWEIAAGEGRSGVYNAIFWATRGGIEGLDIARGTAVDRRVNSTGATPKRR